LAEVSCFSCGKKTLFEGLLSLRAECACGYDLHNCNNCKFYDEKAYHECSEPSAEWVKDKEKANFCDHFEAKSDGVGSGKAKDDLRAMAEALFKKKG
jgi:hypothetical protein